MVSVPQRRGPHLVVDVTVSNSDRELMNEVKTLLCSLSLHPGNILLNTRAGTRTTMGVATSDIWTMHLSRFEEIQDFARTIGFADSVKQDKLRDGIDYIRDLGRKKAAVEWVKHYQLVKRLWVKS